MFTQTEIEHIYEVKQKIISKIVKMIEEPWFDTSISFDRAYLAGGAIASLIQGEEPKDWDIYFDMLSEAEHCAKILKSKDGVKDVAADYLVTPDNNGKMITANAITMQGNYSFIHSIAGKPSEIKKSFDYVHCMAHFSFQDDTLYISRSIYDAAKNKKLVINNPENIKTYRKEKFLERGYVE